MVCKSILEVNKWCANLFLEENKWCAKLFLADNKCSATLFLRLTYCMLHKTILEVNTFVQDYFRSY